MRNLIFICSTVLYPFLAAAQPELLHRKICDLPLEVAESSGLVIQSPESIWTHNDAGYINELFLVDSNGVLLRTVVVENATNMDWEDLAHDMDGNIWINDAGNNSNARTNLRMYKIYADDIANSDLVTADIIDFDFPDQNQFPPPNSNMNFDIEGMLFWNDSLFFFSKNRSNPTTGYTKMYSLPALAGTYTATLVDSFFVDEDLMRSRVTAADVYFPTGTVALLTRSQIMFFDAYGTGSFFSGNVERHYFAARTEQIEALGFLNAHTLYMTDEGDPNNDVPGAWYEVTMDEVTSVRDFFNADFSVRWNVENAEAELIGKEGRNYRVEVYSASGMLVQSKPFHHQTHLDLSAENRGVYIIRVSDGENAWVGKYRR